MAYICLPNMFKCRASVSRHFFFPHREPMPSDAIRQLSVSWVEDMRKSGNATANAIPYASYGLALPGSARLGPALPGSARRGFGTGRPQITCTALGSHLLREETEKDVRQRAMSRCPRTQTVVFVDKLRDCLRDASRGRRTPLRRGSHLLFLGHKPNGTHQLATSFFLKINSKFFSEMRLSRKSFGHPPQDGAPKISVQHGGCIAAMFVSSQRHLVVSGRTTLCFDSLIGYNFILDVQRLRCGAPKCIEYYHEGYFA